MDKHTEPSFHDADIAAMSLSEEEKNGLQVFRNYTRAFERRQIETFVEATTVDESALADLKAVLQLIVTEEPRTLPVIACSFADDQLKAMFRREIPDGVPGGRLELLSGFGPLARLSQRIQMAYAFGWLSKDILIELDLLRKIRNEISHKWDMKLLENKLQELIEKRQQKIEQLLGDGVRLPLDFHQALEPNQKFRLRMIWLLGRITYETQLWVPAMKANLPAASVLYSTPVPPLLTRISTECVSITRSSLLGL